MTKRSVHVATLTAILIIAVGSTLPAAAAPTFQDFVVYQMPCNSPDCNDSSKELKNGDIASGTVQIKARASSTLGIDWLEIQIRGASSGGWTSVRCWTGESAQSGQTQRYNWDTQTIPSTPNWPRGCPSGGPNEADSAPWGKRTANAVYEVRVRARDATGTSLTQVIGIDLSNRPLTPSWFSSPRVIGDKTSSPQVRLEWKKQPDDSVHEYLIVRSAPGRGETEFAVRASNPGSGCTSTSQYHCAIDDTFSQPYGGEYSYWVYGFRKTSAPTSQAGVTSCRTGSGNCIASQGSQTREAQLNDPPPPPSPTDSPTQSASPSPTGTQTQAGGGTRAGSSPTASPSVLARRATVDNRVFFEGEFDEELPFDQRAGLTPSDGPIFGGRDGEQAIGASVPFAPDQRDPTPYRALAGGLLMVLVAAHMARVLRHGARD